MSKQHIDRKKMIMIGDIKLVVLCCLFFLLLGGCGKQEVEYNIEPSSVDEQSGGVKTTELERTSGNLTEQMEIASTVWKETLSADGEDIYVNATIEVPNVSEMYTLEVSEHYYTPEEKKKLVEYFMGTDNVKVNVDKVPTKEWAQKRIERCNNVVGSDYPANEGSYAKSFLNEKKRLEGMMSTLPAKEDVSDVITDYSENYYICEKDGVEYTLSFDLNEDENRSSWSMVAQNKKDYPDGMLYPIYYLDDADDNLSEMTKEEACKKAETICQEVGLSDMKVAAVHDLMISQTVFASDSTEPSRKDGYYIVLTRSIKDVVVDWTSYYGEDAYLDTESLINGYAPEKVVIAISDSGLLKMTYEGCLTAGVMGSPVKLLDFEQIQKIIRSELQNTEVETNTWRGLSLKYIRVQKETESDQYVYIPAWCLCVAETYEKLDSDLEAYNIWVNAIDGSRIDLKEEGMIHYQTIDDELDLMMDIE